MNTGGKALLVKTRSASVDALAMASASTALASVMQALVEMSVACNCVLEIAAAMAHAKMESVYVSMGSLAQTVEKHLAQKFVKCMANARTESAFVPLGGGDLCVSITCVRMSAGAKVVA